MKLTKQQLKKIIKEELESAQQDFTMDEARGEPYETENFRRLSAYGNVGKKAQQMIRDLVADGNYRKLGELSDYASNMDLRKEIPGQSWRGHNPFGFAMKNNPDPAQLERTRKHFFSAFRDAHMNRPKAAPEEAPQEEKPGFMDKIKSFFKEEQPTKLTKEQLMKIIKEELEFIEEARIRKEPEQPAAEKYYLYDGGKVYKGPFDSEEEANKAKDLNGLVVGKAGLYSQKPNAPNISDQELAAQKRKAARFGLEEESAAKKLVDLMSKPMK